jgi:enolase
MTVEVGLEFEDGRRVTASVPAGISAGKYEVAKVPAGQAVAQIGEVKERILNMELDQPSLDVKLTEANMGGNASLAVSAAFWKANLGENKVRYEKFPKLMTLMFEGGKHGNPDITIQEFMLVEESVGDAVADWKKLKAYLEGIGEETTVGAEGGFSPGGFDNMAVFKTLGEVFAGSPMALDVADSFAGGEGVDYGKLVESYNIVSIEDPYSDEEWDKWRGFYDQFGDKIMVVGDDLTVTNKQRLERALSPRVINAIIIKPNQNGTISGTLEVVREAKKNGLKIVVSHRGEETDDDWIADLALAIEAEFVKFGGPDRGERVAKYNRLRLLGLG